MKYCYIDFEYNSVNTKLINVVSASFMANGEINTIWLHKRTLFKKQLHEKMISLHNEGFTFVAYSSEAEARSFLSLTNKPLRKLVVKFRWIDLYVEYKCLANHNHRIQFGFHLIKGKVKKLLPSKPKWEQRDGDIKSPPMERGMASAVYKFLDIEIDSERKNKMRDLIISSPDLFSTAQETAILEYNESDIVHLKSLHLAMIEEYKRLLPRKVIATLEEDMLLRGEYGARTAIMSMDGYPIDLRATKAFSDSVPRIISDIQKEINKNFPDIMPFKFDRKTLKYKWRQKETREWIATLPEEMQNGWMLTKKSKTHPNGQKSLKLDAFRRFFSARHNYRSDNLGDQFVRYLSTKTNMNGFIPSAKSKKTFWDFVGEDGRVRPFWNTYGSQSSRTQPSATSFLYLKSAWMRVLNVPPLGVAIGSIDYGSEEFLIAALQSGDQNMIRAYLSGDVYLYFAKLAGAVPQDGTKEQYPKERDRFKQVTLAMQYLMTRWGLAIELTESTGKEVTEDEAQEFIDMFNEAFPDFYDYREEILQDYREDGYVRLPCGWIMFGDNDNFRSSTNCPTQGMGGSILRKAVQLAQDRGLQIMQTLHDAVYILFKSDKVSDMKVLADCMQEAFMFYFPKEQQKIASQVRLDCAIWSLDYKDEEVEIEVEGLKIKKMKKYIDPRGKEEYHKFKKYFNNKEGLEFI